MDKVYKVADACFINYSSFQDRVFYDKNVSRDVHCHKSEIKESRKHHSEGKMVIKQTHLMDIHVEMQKHFQTLNSDLLSTTKENERDMFDHRNQQFSTILVAATIMLSALVAVLAQGVLHEDSVGNSLLVIIYSISNSLSMSFLFICDIFCMGILWRASQFMKNRSRSHFGYLDKAIKKTKEMVRSIRGVKDKESSTMDVNNSLRSSKKHNCKRRTISHMKDKAIADEYSTNEDELHSYLEQREKIIDKSAYIVSADRGVNLENKSFEYFWEESCSFYGNAAVLMFYAGSGSLIFANGTFVSSTFLFRYRSITGGLITSIIIILTLPIAFALLIYMRYVEDVGIDFDDKHMKMKGKRSIGNEESNSHRIFRRNRKFYNIMVTMWTPFRFLHRLFCGVRGSYSEIVDDPEIENSQNDRNNYRENSNNLNYRINYSQSDDLQSENSRGEAVELSTFNLIR